MKTKLGLLLLILMMTVGCDDSPQNQQPVEQSNEQASSFYGNNDDEQIDEVELEPTKPVNELTTEEKVIGTYEAKEEADSQRIVLLENGVAEDYYNLQKIDSGGKWEISKEGEIHIQWPSGNTFVYKRNADSSITYADSSITYIAFIYRGDRSEEPSHTLKKIK